MKAAIKKRTGAIYTAEAARKFYPTGGTVDDYLYESTDTGFGFAVELRDRESTHYDFELPASKIEPTSQDVLAMWHAVVDFVAAHPE